MTLRTASMACGSASLNVAGSEARRKTAGNAQSTFFGVSRGSGERAHVGRPRPHSMKPLPRATDETTERVKTRQAVSLIAPAIAMTIGTPEAASSAPSGNPAPVLATPPSQALTTTRVGVESAGRRAARRGQRVGD